MFTIERMYMLTRVELLERRARFAEDGVKAMAEYLAQPEVIRARTARLKMLRLEREAADEATDKKKAGKLRKPLKRSN